MSSLIEQGLDVRGLVKAGPLSFPQSIKFKQLALTYAECVAMSSNANPRQFLVPSAGQMIIPLAMVVVTTKTGAAAPQNASFNLRYEGFGSQNTVESVNAMFGNGGAGIQYDADSLNLVNLPFTFNVSLAGRAMFLYNGAATAGVSATSTCVVSCAYFEIQA